MAARIRAMAEGDILGVSRRLEASWQRTYGPLMGPEKVAHVSGVRHAPERIGAELKDRNIMAFVAERADGTLAGYAMARMDASGDVMLDRLHIEPADFGTGLADDLLHVVFAAHSGISSIALEVLEGNARAIAFYRKHGFETVERRDDAHGVEGHASLIMRRPLSRA